MANDELIGRLAELLQQSSLQVVITPQRATLSGLYDAHYSLSLFSCIFMGAHSSQGVITIKEELVRLLHFFAARPSVSGRFIRIFGENQVDATSSLSTAHLLHPGFDDNLR